MFSVNFVNDKLLENISFDKIKIIKIINSNSTIADDGVEQDELSYIKDIIKGEISSEDITKFRVIYEKYQ